MSCSAHAVEYSVACSLTAPTAQSGSTLPLQGIQCPLLYCPTCAVLCTVQSTSIAARTRAPNRSAADLPAFAQCSWHKMVLKLRPMGACWPVGGRYLGDVWALHLDPWTWEAVSTSSLQPPQPAAFEPGKQERPHYLPPCAGHALVPWGSSLLCIGGHTKVSCCCTVPESNGTVCWHSMCTVVSDAVHVASLHILPCLKIASEAPGTIRQNCLGCCLLFSLPKAVWFCFRSGIARQDQGSRAG